MYTQQRSEALQEFQLPELQRTPLDELCLQVSALFLLLRCFCVYSSLVYQQYGVVSYVRPSHEEKISVTTKPVQCFVLLLLINLACCGPVLL